MAAMLLPLSVILLMCKVQVFFYAHSHSKESARIRSSLPIKSHLVLSLYHHLFLRNPAIFEHTFAIVLPGAGQCSIVFCSASSITPLSGLLKPTAPIASGAPSRKMPYHFERPLPTRLSFYIFGRIKQFFLNDTKINIKIG